MTESRIAGIATIPGREAALADVLDRIVPQVDRVYIACNQYRDDHPLHGEYVSRSKVQFHYPDLDPDLWWAGREDNNKFLFLDEGEPGYRFPLDDDILHPPTFIEDSIRCIEVYKRRAVISWGGKRYDNQPVHSYYHGMSESFHALHDQIYDYPVHIPLSGAMCWHTSMIEFDIKRWVHPLMADIWAGLDCLNRGVPVMAVRHRAGYLQHTIKIDLATTIYRQHHNHCPIQTELVNRVWPKISWPISP